MRTDQELLERAVGARETAWCPYSGFVVGACVLGEDRKQQLRHKSANNSMQRMALRAPLMRSVGRTDLVRPEKELQP